MLFALACLSAVLHYADLKFWRLMWGGGLYGENSGI